MPIFFLIALPPVLESSDVLDVLFSRGVACTSGCQQFVNGVMLICSAVQNGEGQMMDACHDCIFSFLESYFFAAPLIICRRCAVFYSNFTFFQPILSDFSTL